MPLILSAAAAVVFCLILCFTERVFWLETPLQVWTALCNVFFLPGALILTAGILYWVSHEGLFDIFTFGARKIGGLRKSKKETIRKESFFDYQTRRKASRKPYQSSLLWVGAVLLAISLVCLFFYGRA